MDNCCQVKNAIHEVFNERDSSGKLLINVCQDLKHLINRPLEHVKKDRPLYHKFIADMHGATTNVGKKRSIQSRNGTWCNVPAPLDEGEVIWKRLVDIVENYKKDLADPDSNFFLKDFEKTFLGQKEHYENCVHEIYDDEMKKQILMMYSIYIAGRNQ